MVIGRERRHLDSVPSTQDVARDAGRAGEPEGLVVTAEVQTAGRGRLGRRWDAAVGSSLLLSVLLRPTRQAYPFISMIGGLAAAVAIEELTELPTWLKWPNDVLVRERKVAGILVEAESIGGEPEIAVLGIGINVNLDPDSLPQVAYPATSLSHEVGRWVDRDLLTEGLVRHLDRLYLDALKGEAVFPIWRDRLITLGRKVRVYSGSGFEEGVAETVDPTGALVVRRPDGTMVSLSAGEVTSQQPWLD